MQGTQLGRSIESKTYMASKNELSLCDLIRRQECWDVASKVVGWIREYRVNAARALNV
jgi:hypothetical protein